MTEQRPPAAVTFRVQGKEPETLTDPHQILLRILDDYLKNPEMVRRIIADFWNQVLDSSDHESYRTLADAVTESIIGHPNDWDGDDSEEYILCQYLKNARDIARHEMADELRRRGLAMKRRSDAAILFASADEQDPYQLKAEGTWVRKSDGTVVSWPIVRD